MTRASVRERYQHASKRGNGKILDEAAQVTGYHRKALLRPLGRRSRGDVAPPDT